MWGSPGPQLPVDLAEGLVRVLAEVLLQGVDDDQSGPVLFGEEDLERLAPAGQEVDLDLVELLVDADLALDADHGIGALEVLLGQGDPGDPGLLQGLDGLRSDLLPGRDQDLLRLGVGDVLGRRPADEAVPDLPGELSVLGDDLDHLVEEPQDVLVGPEAQGPQEDRGQELLLAVQADPQVVLGVVLELDPGAPVRDELADEKALGLGLPEEYARRPLELADDDPLDAVEDERALFRHQRDVAEVDLLLLDVLEALGLGDEVLLPRDELDAQLQRHRVGVALLDALGGRVLHLEADPVPAVVAEGDLDLPRRPAVRADLLLGQHGLGREERAAGVALRPGVLDPLEPAALAFPGPDGIAEELELGGLLEIGYREDVLEGGLEADLLPLFGQKVHLEILVVGRHLDIQEVGHGEDRLDLREVDPLKISICFFVHILSLSKEFHGSRPGPRDPGTRPSGRAH